MTDRVPPIENLSATDSWAVQAAEVAKRAPEIEAAVAPLRRPLADDIDAYVRSKPGTPWMMVDVANASTETNDSTQMRTLLSTIMADCEASIVALRSLQFSPSHRYPDTEQGAAAWSEGRESAIRQTRNFITLLSSGGADVDLQGVSNSAKYCAQSLQNWNVLSDSLRGNMLSLCNTLANYCNVDGLSLLYETRCEKAVSVVKVVVHDVENALGIQQNNNDLSRSDLLREASRLRAGNLPKFLALQIESWLERIRRDAKNAPVKAPDTPPERPAESATAETVAFTTSGFRALMRSLFKRG